MLSYTREQFCALTGITVAAYKSDRRQGFLPTGVMPPEDERLESEQTGGPVGLLNLDDQSDRRHSRFSPTAVLAYVASLELRSRFKMTATEATSVAYEAIGRAWTHFDASERAECLIGVLYLDEDRPEYFAGSAKKLAERITESDVTALALVSLDASFARVADRARNAEVSFPADLAAAVLSR